VNCNGLHDTFNEAALCCPDVVEVDDPDSNDTVAEQRTVADAQAQKCPFCAGCGYYPFGDVFTRCIHCDGTGISKSAWRG